MMLDKFVLHRGVYYEGDSQDLRAIHPTPVVSRATCNFLDSGGGEPIFREDSFDPVTRIRRGRMYVGGRRGQTWYPGRVDHGFYNPSEFRRPPNPWTPDLSYDAWSRAASFQELMGKVIQLGENDFETHWRIVGVERIAIGHTLLTLRATSLQGTIPDLASAIIDITGKPIDAKVASDALDALVDAFHRQLATPTVDVARETAKVLLTAWIGKMARGKDLGDVIKAIPEDKALACWAASIINRMHPRGKSSERESHASKGVELRLVTDEDAEASVHLVGLILREIGWAIT
ncbi:hypothetical protein B1A_07836 [mine drainage metagenome]|uniref:Uncharacterized protein n=2 Tax=mine drainage metagenome TaxID=410659 RepID=T1CI80_9ZZZZ